MFAPLVGFPGEPTYEGMEILVSDENSFLNLDGEGGRTLTFQGKMKGGGSGINGGIWTKPDLDNEFGSDSEWPSGWDKDLMEKAFRAVEDGPRSNEGLVKLEKNSFGTNFTDVLLSGLAAFSGIDLFTTEDYNAVGDDIQIIEMSEIAKKNGQRHDAFLAYIESLESEIRDKITVMDGVTVESVEFEEIARNAAGDASGQGPQGGTPGNGNGPPPSELKAKGVNSDGGFYCALQGVVLAAGALQSPAILERSNVGKDMAVDNSEVGENLQDHLSLLQVFGMGAPPNYIFNDFPQFEAQVQEYFQFQTGLFADSFAKLLIFSKERDSVVHNFEAEFFEGLPFFVNPNFNPEDPTSGPLYGAIGFAAQTLDISSKGYVHDPVNFAFTANWGSENEELEIMADGIQRIRRLLSTITAETGLPFFELGPDGGVAMDPTTGQPVPVNPEYRDTINVLRAKLAATAPEQAFPVYTAFHYCGSLSLGKVVDPETMEVMGEREIRVNPALTKTYQQNINGLHVVDASLFPKIPRKNTMSLTYAVSEIASSKILGYEL